MTDRTLTIAPGVHLPAMTSTQRLAFIGTSNSGKSYAALKLAEQMTYAGEQWIALDPMGIWYAIRLAADGVSEGLNITIFGGAHGDVPIKDTDGALVADVIVQQRISAVIDTSEFETDAEKTRFATAFADRLYWLKKSNKSAVHLFLEEAHEYVPQNSQPGEATMVHVFNRLWKQGGNYGIGGSLISQRPQDVNKKALELTAAVFLFNVVGANAVDAVTKWLKGTAGIEKVRHLDTGTCILWSPSWLKIEQTIKIDPRETFHARFDPLAPVEHREIQTLDASAIAKLREAFTAAVEEKKNTDPEELRKRIKELEAAKPQPTDAQIAAEVEKIAGPLRERNAHLETILNELVNILDRVQSILKVEERVGETVQEATNLEIPSDFKAPPIPVPKPETDTPGVITHPQQRILDALGSLKSCGVKSADRAVVAALAGQSPKSSSYRINLANLRSASLIRIESQTVALTTDGESRTAQTKPARLADLHSLQKAMLKGPQVRMFNVLVSMHPKSVTVAELASLSSQSLTSSSFRINVTKLRSFGFITGSKEFSLTEIVFPKGLK